MAYLELSLEAYDDIIKAAGNRGAQVSKVCREQGVWEAAAAEEAPPDSVPEQLELDMGAEVPDAAEEGLAVPDPEPDIME